MIDALIIEDEQLICDNITDIIERNFKLIKLQGTAASIVDAVELINQKKPALVFMDIRLKDGTSFEIFKKISTYNFYIIFITAYQQYSLEAIKLLPIGYILKPIIETELVSAVNSFLMLKDNGFNMDKIKEQELINFVKDINSPENMFNVTLNGYKTDINVNQIVYIKAEGSYSTLKLSNKKEIIVSKKISKIESELPKNTFQRIHKTYLVNTNYVETIHKANKEVVLKNGETIPLASRRLKDFFDFLSYTKNDD